MSAFVNETLRYFTVIAMCLPRASIKPIQYRGATIPAVTLFYMNARGADFDSERFSDPPVFNPGRYIRDKSLLIPVFVQSNPTRPAKINGPPSLILVMGRVPVCVWVRTLPIARCMLPFPDLFLHSNSPPDPTGKIVVCTRYITTNVRRHLWWRVGISDCDWKFVIP